MDNNFFEGAIPQSLKSLRAIRELNLFRNNFTGKIPRYLAEFKLLEALDLSLNNFEGEVAIQGVFLNSSAVSVFGNKRLCGGIAQLNLPKCSSIKPKSSAKLTLTVSITCGLLGLISLAFFLLLCHFKRRRSQAASQSPLEHSSYQDLNKATNGFSSTNLIGVGSFGLVYRGILEQDRMTIAVKVLNLLHKGGSKSFAAECQALACIRHRNLVKLISVCSSIDFQGNDFQALIYEFMVNGSLEEWLHPVYDLYQTHQSRNLSFSQRLYIAIDVASALEYLHHYGQISIVHCDLKPNNVLLDVDMSAHVGDFELARLLSDAFHQNSSIGIKGTIGYVAPEYGMGSEVSTYGDIYSYGILLLEMFTGKKPTDSMFNDEHNLRSFAQIGLENNVEDIIDPTLLYEYEGASANTSSKVNNIRSDKILECSTLILKIGVACSIQTPRERMDMKSVVAALHRIKRMLLVARHR